MCSTPQDCAHRRRVRATRLPLLTAFAMWWLTTGLRAELSVRIQAVGSSLLHKKSGLASRPGGGWVSSLPTASA